MDGICGHNLTVSPGILFPIKIILPLLWNVLFDSLGETPRLSVP